MYKVHPSLQADSSLLPQFLCSNTERSCSPLIIRYTGLFAGEQGLVEIPCQVSPVRICHLPHRPDDTPESTVLHRCGEVQCLVSYARFRNFRSVTAGKKCEFRIRELGLYDVQQRET